MYISMPLPLAAMGSIQKSRCHELFEVLDPRNTKSEQSRINPYYLPFCSLREVAEMSVFRIERRGG